MNEPLCEVKLIAKEAEVKEPFSVQKSPYCGDLEWTILLPARSLGRVHSISYSTIDKLLVYLK